MELDFLKKIDKNDKNDNFLKGFISELNNFLETNIAKNSLNTSSILEQILKNNKITVKYRDKMYIERNHILNNFADKTREKGEMFYIFSKDEKYNLYNCKEEESHNIIEVDKNEIPTEAGVDSVLRIQNGKYVLDEETTDYVKQEIIEMTNKLINEQQKYLQSNRIEGHVYEVGEIEKDRVWLYDKNLDDTNGIEAIEEIDFPTELIEQIEEGDNVKFENGEYVRYLGKT